MHFTPHPGQRLINLDPPHQRATVIRCRKRARTVMNLYNLTVRLDDGQQFESINGCWWPAAKAHELFPS